MFISVFVCSFVSRIMERYSTDFHKIRLKGGTWTTEEALDFGGNPDHVTLRLRLGKVTVTVTGWVRVIPHPPRTL